MDIKAAVVREKSGPFVMEDIQLDEPRADEVIVRVVSAGICHTDLIPREPAIPAPFPAVYGHEGAGVVERVGSQVTKLKPGDHVVMSFNSQLPAKREGRANQKARRVNKIDNLASEPPMAITTTNRGVYRVMDSGRHRMFTTRRMKPSLFVER